MAVVISNESLERHSVNQYNFKVLALGSNTLEEDESHQAASHPKEEEKEKKDGVDSSGMSQDSRNSLIESLMKKTEDMSSNFIKLQMKLESKEEEFKVELKKAREEAFAEGMAEQAKQSQNQLVIAQENAINQFANSVGVLENTAKEFEVALESIKGELMSAAVDIAKEVIQVELSQNSNEVAKILADNLMSELQDASEITLRVSPINHGALSEKIGITKRIKSWVDSAISEGGVVAISNIGNIDSQISNRFEKVKRAVLSE